MGLLELTVGLNVTLRCGRGGPDFPGAFEFDGMRGVVSVELLDAMLGGRGKSAGKRSQGDCGLCLKHDRVATAGFGAGCGVYECWARCLRCKKQPEHDVVVLPMGRARTIELTSSPVAAFRLGKPQLQLHLHLHLSSVTIQSSRRIASADFDVLTFNLHWTNESPQPHFVPLPQALLHIAHYTTCRLIDRVPDSQQQEARQCEHHLVLFRSKIVALCHTP